MDDANDWVEQPTLQERLGLTRCFMCNRLRLLHTRPQLDRCEGTPLNATFTPEGMAAWAAYRASLLYDQDTDADTDQAA
jgi:hypothetical protein